MIDIKICGVTTADAIEAAIKHQVKYIGLVFYSPSPRSIKPEDAAKLIAPYIGEIEFVGLFVNASDEKITNTLDQVKLDMIQLHGCETPERVREIKAMSGLPIIKAFPIESKKSLHKIPSYYKDVEWFLFDAKPGPNINKMTGGMGRTFDWSLLEGYQSPRPWMLAGGLNKDNVPDALLMLRPNVVDLSSGLETAPGVKCPQKIKEFIETIKQTHYD